MLKNAKEKTFIYYPWFILQQNTDVTVIQIHIKLLTIVETQLNFRNYNTFLEKSAVAKTQM